MAGYRRAGIIRILMRLYGFRLSRLSLQVGQVDFYPNNGTAPQPGCEDEEPWGMGCSHERACVMIDR